MKQHYIDRKFTPKSLGLIETINGIVDEYIEQNFRLTVRQLYYQLVARAIIENTERSYKNICSLINDARLAGLMDWDAIEDRTRAFVRRTRWESGRQILDSAAAGYHMDMWENQEWRVFVIVEKEALAGVLEGVCGRLDVPLLAARGYPSVSVLREFAINDLLPAMGFDRDFGRLPGSPAKGLKQNFMILHLGDHDPSGLDMSNDLSKRLAVFCGLTPGKLLPNTFFTRIALNMNQIRAQKPPENPAKTTDARYKKYRDEYGDSSWELDALKPEYLTRLVEDNTARYINVKRWDERQKEINSIKKRIGKVAESFR